MRDPTVADDPNEPRRLPWRLSDFLSGAYHTISIVVVLVGLIVWAAHQQARIDFLIERDKEHPTKQELVEVAIKVDNRIANLEKTIADHTSKSDLSLLAARLDSVNRHVDDLDTHGTAALRDRVNLIELLNRGQDERIQELIRRINDMQTELNKIGHEVSIVVERQGVNTEAIKALHQRLHQYSGGERGPTAPNVR